jgi:hypothetical protein
MYKWFSFGIILLELVSSIHFNLMNISSKQFIYLQLSCKSLIDVQLLSKHSSIFRLSTMYMWKNIFHVILMWHKDILKILCPHHQNIPNIFTPTHKLMFTCVRFLALLKLVRVLNKFSVVALYSTHLEHQPLGLRIAPPPPQSNGMWKIHGSCKGTALQWKIAMFFFIHILQYLLIIWGGNEMITIKKRNIIVPWRKHLRFQMKMRREMFRMNSSLYHPHENLSYTL